MKIKAIIVLTVCIMLNLPGIELVKDGKSDYKIALPNKEYKLDQYGYPRYEHAFTDLTYAAEFLNKYLQKVTNIKLDIVKEADIPEGGKAIYLGNTGFAQKHVGDLTKLDAEELVIKTVGDSIIICGKVTQDEIDQGTLFAVYEFLERILGVRWYFGDAKWYAAGLGIVIPKKSTVEFDELDIRDKPFSQRRIGFASPSFFKTPKRRLDWHPVLRFGNSKKQLTANHTQNLWVDLYGETHPEYFAIRKNGKRYINNRYKHRNYLCFSNPAVLEQMIKNIEEFDRTKNLDFGRKAFSGFYPDKNTVYFNPNDGMTPDAGLCHCPECKKLHKPEDGYWGHASELVFDFIRRYALAIKEKWPNRRLTVLAYSCYRKIPNNIEIPDNVDVTIVTNWINYHNEKYLEAESRNIDDWYNLLGQDKNRLSIWCNTGGPNYRISSMPVLFPHNIRKFMDRHKNKITGYFIGGVNPGSRKGGDVSKYGGLMAYPMFWLQSKMVWNPEQDPDQLLQQYCQDLFGPAAEPMHQFYKILTERWENYYEDESWPLGTADFIHQVRYPPDIIIKLKQLLEKAVKQTAVKSQYRKRVQWINRIFSRGFISENQKYNKWSGQVATYNAMFTDTLPVIDGKLDDKCWKNKPELQLVERKYGDIPDRKSKICLIHDKKNLYLAARFFPASNVKSDWSKTELRVQTAKDTLSVMKKFAFNIDKKWKAFREIRLLANGNIIGYPKVSDKVKLATNSNDKELIFEAKIPLTDLLPAFNLEKGHCLRMQFVRYWGIWDKFTLWSPTVSHISDYNTWRFGTVHFLEPTTPKAKDGLR